MRRTQLALASETSEVGAREACEACVRAPEASTVSCSTLRPPRGVGWGGVVRVCTKRTRRQSARAPQTTTRAYNVRRTAGRPESPRLSMASTYPPGSDRPCAVLERRADLQFYWPVASGELQAPAKLRPVDRVSGSQFVRSLRRSRVRAEYRARGARPASSDRVNRPPGADWAPHAALPPAARQLPRGQHRWRRRTERLC